MSEFFRVKDPHEVFDFFAQFNILGAESLPLLLACDRVMAADFIAVYDLPPFNRSVVDGYALKAESSFGASEAIPVYLELKENIQMGQVPETELKPGETSYIPTGGMLPVGADAVVMVENSGLLNANTVEIYKSVAPFANMVQKGEDFNEGQLLLRKGDVLRAQDVGVLAAFGRIAVDVYRKPVVGIISSGDEIVEPAQTPALGQMRDINSYTLGALVQKAGGEARLFGIAKDDFDDLYNRVRLAVDTCDVVIISGGSSVGTRDYTLKALEALDNSQVLMHGVAISPGKPTILANCNGKAVWGLPGHASSAMVIFGRFLVPFLACIGGRRPPYEDFNLALAILTRNVASAQGREDFVRARIVRNAVGELTAEPILGKSSLINTMVHADGLIKIDKNLEGVKAGTVVQVILF